VAVGEMINVALAEIQAALERRAPFNWSGSSEHVGLGCFVFRPLSPIRQLAATNCYR
jgi:hypothetical protein